MAVELVLSCAVLLLLLVLTLITKHRRGKETQNKAAGYKPIPHVKPCLPFFGNALHVDTTNFHLTLTELKERYGPVFYLQLFREKILILSDFPSVHQALVGRGGDFAGRPSTYRTSRHDRHRTSIVWQTYTSRLVLLRKLAHRSLKTYGAGGLDRLEQRCAPDIQQLCDQFRQSGGKAFDPYDFTYQSVCSIMLYLTLGIRFDYSNPIFQSIREINELFNDTYGSGKGKQLDFVPLLRLFQSDGYARMQKALQLRDQLWSEQLHKIKTSKVDPDSIVPTILKHLKTSGDQHDLADSSSLSSSLTSASLPSSSSSTGTDGRQEKNDSDLIETTAKEVFTNLVLAGTDTTSTALTCLLLLLCHHGDVQRGLQEEVDRVLGPLQAPRLQHRDSMPYLMAVLLELLRYISHVPLAVPHFTMRDTSVLDHHIPANTTVFINLWSLHHDEAEWTHPWRFNPSRFLDDRGQLLPAHHERRRKLLPFGAGRRVCLGEVLAKNRLFLFAAALVQQFHFEAEDVNDLPPVDPRTYEMGLVIHPKPFRIHAVPRNCAVNKSENGHTATAAAFKDS